MNPTRAAQTWASWIDDQCRIITGSGRWRTIRTLDAEGHDGVLVESGRPVVSFASNDYLGLTQHPAVKAAAVAAIERWGTGSGASRLVVGSRPIHDELERRLASWRGTEAALVFPTGYAANTGLLAVLGQTGVRVCSDELNHASIVDGCRMARANGADVRVYRHGDVDALAHQLKGADRAVVVTDTVFSMDGDLAPLIEIADLCARSNAVLVVDDAHKVFPIAGLDEDDSLGPAIVRVGTLSKTLGSLGGFVAGSRAFIDLLVNRARPFIFTTAPTPADTAAASAALDIVTSAEGGALVTRLRDHVDTLRPGHPSPIIPIVIGGEDDAVAASSRLLERGLLVPAIRPPTVPAGTSRLRIALSATHTTEQVARLGAALRSVA
jgi:8-amino-7-oxononanoate synthase